MKNVIKVNKSKFSIERSLSGIYSIEGCIDGVMMAVWGGDSACEDHHDVELMSDNEL